MKPHSAAKDATSQIMSWAMNSKLHRKDANATCVLWLMQLAQINSSLFRLAISVTRPTAQDSTQAASTVSMQNVSWHEGHITAAMAKQVSQQQCNQHVATSTSVELHVACLQLLLCALLMFLVQCCRYASCYLLLVLDDFLKHLLTRGTTNCSAAC